MNVDNNFYDKKKKKSTFTSTRFRYDIAYRYIIKRIQVYWRRINKYCKSFD